VKLAIKRRQLSEQVSELTTNRLSVYLRCLNALDASGVKTISSQSLAQQFHLNAAQIRKDLANFGEFGVRGVGYYVKDLQQHLRQILGLERKLTVAIFGAGNLGLALADYPGFRQEGFRMVALFDALPSKVGSSRAQGFRSSTSGISGRSRRAKRSRSRSSPYPPTRRRTLSIRSSRPASRRSSTSRPVRLECRET
jgi:hypothetical protein